MAHGWEVFSHMILDGKRKGGKKLPVSRLPLLEACFCAILRP
ncbi:hypothetical protein NBRC3257_0431 [Gluconobacter thailandicus NBRC 3257]|uniref:Transposase n=1 Tax=Gluconobacter thailandicus NBRC 3257 TaxID=1381097 RepID=A0ABQ0ITA6_GLUTH|nr:hypothetical protein NBRC3255_1268 [Gluconobacter thailandicus NBRC 3255]GAD25432.1 hypothetical protein NBRC3257_0431 [Gluconobacter thailandicus NBRC 3257]